MKDCIAVIDIGSNAVRLVIYDKPDSAPIKVHTERVMCRLGKGIVQTGRLNPEGCALALETLGRFCGLLDAMHVRDVHVVATAALRMAKDGSAFIRQVKKICGLSICIIDGDEEARLSALGVMTAGRMRDGVIGDFGGGSLEITWMEKGRMRGKASLPVGSNALYAQKDNKSRRAFFEQHLHSVDFLEACQGKDLFLLGGAWRSLARAHMRTIDYPLQIVDQYTIPGTVARNFSSKLSGGACKSSDAQSRHYA